MFELIGPLIVFLLSLLGIIFLGLLAGFSPTLYFTQIAVGMKSKNSRVYSMSLIAGVLLAIIVLSFLFQILNLQTLLDFIDSTIHALIIAVVFNIFIAIGLIIGGFWYINYPDEVKKSKLPPLKPTTKSSGKVSATVSFSFIRTFTSISGITATYVASNTIAATTSGLPEQIIYTSLFLFSAILPFLIIFILIRNKSTYMVKIVDSLKQFMQRFNYRLTIGVTAIIIGCSIFILQIMTALFY